MLYVIANPASADSEPLFLAGYSCLCNGRLEIIHGPGAVLLAGRCEKCGSTYSPDIFPLLNLAHALAKES